MKTFAQFILLENDKYQRPEFISYRDAVEKSLDNLYESRFDYRSGDKHVRFIYALGYEKQRLPEKKFSVLNKVNTNEAVKRYLLSEFRGIDGQDFWYWIWDNRFAFFVHSLKRSVNKFEKIFDIIRKTEASGEQREEYVCQVLPDLMRKHKMGESTCHREVTNSINDMIFGIDAYLEFAGDKKYTIQIKPLREVTPGDYNYVIKTSGKFYNYKTSLICFADTNRHIFLVDNKASFRVERVGGDVYVYIPKKYIILDESTSG